MKKYFKTKREALKVCSERNKGKGIEWYMVFKMPKGTRHHGEYAVCSEMECIKEYGFVIGHYETSPHIDLVPRGTTIENGRYKFPNE